MLVIVLVVLWMPFSRSRGVVFWLVCWWGVSCRGGTCLVILPWAVLVAGDPSSLSLPFPFPFVSGVDVICVAASA